MQTQREYKLGNEVILKIINLLKTNNLVQTKKLV